MLVNTNANIKTSINESHVKSISYTGRYPCLCSGILTLEIDCKRTQFGYGTSNNPFWTSGGVLKPNYEGTYQREWEIDVNSIPEEYHKYSSEIDRVFNENVEWGCCGGCI